MAGCMIQGNNRIIQGKSFLSLFQEQNTKMGHVEKVGIGSTISSSQVGVVLRLSRSKDQQSRNAQPDQINSKDDMST
jgi:hypothetical protein